MKTTANSQALTLREVVQSLSSRASRQKNNKMRLKTNLMLNSMSVPQLIAFAQHMVSRMTGNSFFATPSPLLTVITTAVNALQLAYDNAQGGGPAQTAIMHQKREALELLLTAEGHYVEDRANDPANAAAGAEAIILSAGINIRQTNPRQKSVFTASIGKIQGSAVLTAAHVDRGAHDWQYTLDPNQANSWIQVDQTIKATVTIVGLESLKHYYFRHRLILKDGASAWEGPVEMLVL